MTALPHPDDTAQSLRQRRSSRANQKVTTVSERRLKTLLELTRVGIWDWDIRTGQVTYNPQWYQVLGYEEGEVISSSDAISELIHPDDRTDVIERLQGLLIGQSEEYASEHRLKTPGGYIWVKDRGGIAERDAEGRAIRVMGSISDITEQRQADKLIAEQKRKLDIVMEAAEIGYFEWNCITHELAVSEQYARMLGYTASELSGLGQTGWRAMVHPEDLPDTDLLLAEHLMGHTPTYQCELRMRHRAGHWVWIMARGRVTQFDVTCRPMIFSGTHQDISRIKQAEESARRNEELLKSAIDTINEALVIFDPDDKLVFCNERYRECYPLTRDTMKLGVSFETIIRTWKERGGGDPPPEGIDAWVQSRIKAHREGNVFIQRVENDRYMRVVERTTPTGYVVGFRVEITDLVAAQHQAEAANIAKSRFLATMSHELRTPLNGILGMAQLLQQSDVSEQERTQFTQTILHSGQALLALLNDILDLSKVESGKMELELAPVQVERLLDETRSLYVSSARQKGLDFEVKWCSDRTSRFLGDGARLRQMINNLVSNAIKFTESGCIQLMAHPVPSEGQEEMTLEFSVRDTGVGIPESKQHVLFQPFSQVDASVNRQFGGTGLGLSIVRSLAVLMGGQAGVESREGEGSRFWFRVPLRPLSPDPSPENVAPTVPMPAPFPELYEGQVLVVEDHPMNRMVISNMLQRLGLTVHMVHDGQQALDILNSGLTPAIVFMDVEMPVLDGYSATRRIRQRERSTGQSPLTVVALTANAFDSDRREAMEAGMDDFIPKPISLTNLKRALGRWLSHSTLMQGDQA